MENYFDSMPRDIVFIIFTYIYDSRDISSIGNIESFKSLFRDPYVWLNKLRITFNINNSKAITKLFSHHGHFNENRIWPWNLCEYLILQEKYTELYKIWGLLQSTSLSTTYINISQNNSILINLEKMELFTKLLERSLTGKKRSDLFNEYIGTLTICKNNKENYNLKLYINLINPPGVIIDGTSFNIYETIINGVNLDQIHDILFT